MGTFSKFSVKVYLHSQNHNDKIDFTFKDYLGGVRLCVNKIY